MDLVANAGVSIKEEKEDETEFTSNGGVSIKEEMKDETELSCNAGISIKEEREDETALTTPVVSIKEEEMPQIYHDEFIHVKQEEVVVPDEDGLIHVKQEEETLVPDEGTTHTGILKSRNDWDTQRLGDPARVFRRCCSDGVIHERSMNEQAFNIKFVGEVEKFPVLYNYKLKEYSRKDVTEKTWNEVAKIVNLSITECKEKWKNLRSVFVCRLKPPPSGSGNKTKPYYLSEAMQFTLPYIRTVEKPEGNFPEEANVPPSTSVVSDQLSEDTSQQHHLSEEEKDSSFTYSTEVPPSPPFLFESQSASSPLIESYCTPTTSVNTPAFKKKCKQDTFTDADKSFKDYMDAKRRKLENQTRDSQAKKQFLDSLLPEIEPLTEEQMRSFRRRVLQLIDEIRFPHGQYQLGLDDTRITSPNLYSSSTCSSAPMHAESRPNVSTMEIKDRLLHNNIMKYSTRH